MNKRVNLLDVEGRKGHRLVRREFVSGMRNSTLSVDDHARWLVVTVVVMVSYELGNTQLSQPVRD